MEKGKEFSHSLTLELRPTGMSPSWHDFPWTPLPLPNHYRHGDTAVESQKPRLTLFRAAPTGVDPAAQGGQLGIFSGAFNPITVAHVALARSAFQHYHLHEVLFLLPLTQPHRLIVDASIEARLHMMALAVQDDPAFSVGSCTHGLFIDICRAVETAYPAQTHLWFITGRDAAERVLTWPYPDPARALGELFAHAELLVADREGSFVVPEIPSVRSHAERIHTLPLPPEYNPISATDVRMRLGRGKEVAALVPPPVLTYIQQHRFYHTGQESPPA